MFPKDVNFTCLDDSGKESAIRNGETTIEPGIEVADHSKHLFDLDFKALLAKWAETYNELLFGSVTTQLSASQELIDMVCN